MALQNKDFWIVYCILVGPCFHLQSMTGSHTYEYKGEASLRPNKITLFDYIYMYIYTWLSFVKRSSF
jgi:hypothetical protein